MGVVIRTEGQVRMAGNAHEVVSAYKTAMARGNDKRVREEKNRETKAHFIRWETDVPKDEDPYVL